MRISSEGGRVIVEAGNLSSTMSPAEALERASRLAKVAGQALEPPRTNCTVDLGRVLLPGGRIPADEAMVLAVELFAAGASAALEQMLDGSTVRPEISPARRRELMAFALTLADMVEEKTQPHERCLLRGMVEMLVIQDR